MRHNRITFLAVVVFIVLSAVILMAAKGQKSSDVAMPNTTTPSPSITNSPLRSNNILVESPLQNTQISNPVTVRGEARTFENTVIIRLVQDDGRVLAEDFTTADAKDIGQFGAFEIQLFYSAPTQNSGKIEVFQYSAKDGSEIDKVLIPVRLSTNDQITVNVYFTNERDSQECENVSGVQRIIPRTQQTARAALLQLLRGTTTDEEKNGLRTNINKGVRIQKLNIEKGVARVDFDDTLQVGVAGSCRVLAIRAQIIQTLLQFDTIDSVVISINGKTEDILQP